MKAPAVNLIACIILLSVHKFFCSSISLPADVKDAMVRNQRAHVVKLIPFVETNNILSGAEALQHKTSSSDIAYQSIFFLFELTVNKQVLKFKANYDNQMMNRRKTSFSLLRKRIRSNLAHLI